MQDKKQYIGQIITISNQNQLALYYTTIRLNHFREIDISLTITRPCCPFINHYKETNISYNRHNIQYLVRKQAPLFNMPTAMTFDEEQVQQAKKILENDRKTREKRHALNAALIKKGIPFSKTVRFNDMMKNHADSKKVLQSPVSEKGPSNLHKTGGTFGDILITKGPHFGDDC